MIEKDILDAIDKSLPNMVGDTLKKRLEQADFESANLKKVQEKVNGLEAELTRYKTLDSKFVDLEKRDRATSSKESELNNRETILKLNEEFFKIKNDLISGRLQDNKEIVMAVFANNKIKYSEFGSSPMLIQPSQNGMYPNIQQQPFSKTNEVTG